MGFEVYGYAKPRQGRIGAPMGFSGHSGNGASWRAFMASDMGKGEDSGLDRTSGRACGLDLAGLAGGLAIGAWLTDKM